MFSNLFCISAVATAVGNRGESLPAYQDEAERQEVDNYQFRDSSDIKIA
jgi:hypothetical protein